MFTKTQQYFQIPKSEQSFSYLQNDTSSDIFALSQNVNKLNNCCSISVPVHHALVETSPFHQFQGWWRPKLEEEEPLDLDPDIPLTDKDDQEEEPSQNVAGIQNPEGYLDILTGLTGLIVMVVDKEMNSLNGPQNAKNQEQFHVKDLKYRVINTG